MYVKIRKCRRASAYIELNPHPACLVCVRTIDLVIVRRAIQIETCFNFGARLPGISGLVPSLIHRLDYVRLAPDGRLLCRRW